MAKWLAFRIIGGHLEYVEVTTKFPNFKEAIDAELIANNREDLIV